MARYAFVFYYTKFIKKTSQILKPEPNLNFVQIFEAQCPYIRLFESISHTVCKYEFLKGFYHP